MVLTFENSRVLCRTDPFCPAPFFLLVTGLILYCELGISSLTMLSFGREIFLTRFEFDRVLSLRICNVDSSIIVVA